MFRASRPFCLASSFYVVPKTETVAVAVFHVEGAAAVGLVAISRVIVTPLI